MNVSRKPIATLTDAWERLESLCRRLWDDNSAAAVEAQAVYEEFKSEVHRIDALLANLDELHEHERHDHEEDLAAMRRQYELELAGLRKRLEQVEKGVQERDARIDGLLQALAKKEEENLEFHSQVLRMSASSDETKTKKMEEFYQELVKKESGMEASWAARRQALEEEHAHLRQLLAAKQSDLESWEKRRLSDEDSLKRRATDVELKSQQLAQEYRRKQQEIDDLKKSLQTSITELVRQYQARLRGGSDPASTPHPR